MPALLVVYIGGSSLSNLEFGLTNQRWAFTKPDPDLDLAVDGDLFLFGVGAAGGPRRSEAEWRSGSLDAVHVARLKGRPYASTVPFWPDEVRAGVVRYNPTIDLQFLGTAAGVPLRPGRALSAAVVEGLRLSGIGRAAVLGTTSGSPLLRGGAALQPPTRSAARPRSGAGRGTRSGTRLAAADVLFAPLPKKAADITVMNEQPPVGPVIIRREQVLVDEYRTHMEKKGHPIVRLKISAGSLTLWNDIYDKKREALIEAKGSSDRESIRMALGQVLDYVRHSDAKIRGILVPDKPDADLIDLLARNQITAIWRKSRGFSDSSGGALT